MSYVDHSIGSGEYEAVLAKAASHGMELIPADDYLLQIDIDTEEDYKRWLLISNQLLPKISTDYVDISESISGYPHRHITVYLNEPMELWKRISLQLLLGSHHERELMNAFRVLTGDTECPIVFFEPDQKPRRRRMIQI
jgi:hypothetical protein